MKYKKQKYIIVGNNNPFYQYLKSKESSKNKNSDLKQSSKIEKIEEKNNNDKIQINDTKSLFFEINSLNNFLLKYSKEFYEKFELLEMIKSGSAGVVYRGKLKNKKNPKEIAFKFLFDNNKENTKKKSNKKSEEDELNVNNHHSEILLHGMLKNKHIPYVYGYYQIHNSSCIAMEFDKYGDIESFKRKILKKNCLSETFLLYIAGGIIEALFYIHIKNKIIHMDIKQQNVLIDDFLMVKLTDFSVGINYKSEKNYIDLPMVGTCYYMSPEVLNRKRILVSEASKIDIYSLGVLLYFLAFYDYPYKLNEVNSKDYPQIAKNIEENNLQFPENTGHSKVFKNFLKNCLSKDIKKRYNIYEAMIDPWYKGYKIILDEKEKLYNAGKLVIDFMFDNIIPLNNYIKKQEIFL